MKALNSSEREQYSRHLILSEIGEEGQLKLKQSKVLIIGAGGLGCPVLQYLVAVGVGTIGIVDGDLVSQSNLQRQILFTIDDIGKSKAEVAKEKLEKLNPFVTIKTYTEYLSTENSQSIFKEYDIIVDATDNFPARYLINDTAILTDKPLVFGSIFKFEGQVSVFNYKGGPTYRCLFPIPPKPNEVPSCSEIGVLGVLPGMIGCLQANETIKIICEIGQVLSGKLLTLNALSLNQMIVSFQKTKESQITTLLQSYDWFCGISTIKEITKKEYQIDKNSYNLLDVRTYKERQDFNIGGQHIPLDEIEKRYSEINIDKPLIVYCKSGMRSKKAISMLTEKLKIDLFNLKEGVF